MIRTFAIILLCCGITVANDLPQQIQTLQLTTFGGADWKLPTSQNAPVLVFAFLGTECPLAKLYGPRLQELQDEFADQGVLIVGVNSNTQDSLADIKNYMTKYRLKFPMLKDVDHQLADLLKAERTPEVVVLSDDRNIVYRGRIDDQYLVGVSRPAPQRRDLAVALTEILDDHPVSVAATKPMGCHIGRNREVTQKGDITWAKHIAPIFQQRCMECHRDGEVAPFSLTDYESVRGWEETILEVIDDNRMPPWYADPAHGTFRNDPRLSDKEKTQIRTWVKNGMPPGDLAEVPEPPKFTQGWRIQQPDQVIHMDTQAFQVPAQGVVDYQYFSVDPGWTEDKYVVAAEARPDNIPVVHHIIAYIIEPDNGSKRKFRRRMLVGYAPGSLPMYQDEQTAIHIKAGSKLLFEMHYTPNGQMQSDRSYIGLKFTEKKNVKRLLQGRLAATNDFEIPPHADNHVVTAARKIRQDSLLLDMTPHMHLRGKAFRYDAVFPNGQKETLLNVPRYDFNWQLSYQLAKPRRLPAGTRIICTATYDNSANNLVNPAPDNAVRWGDQSDEEMMIGFFTVVDAD